MREVIIVTPEAGEKAVRVITVSFIFDDTENEEAVVDARYEITTAPENADDAFEEPCVGIDFGLGRFCASFADHGQTEKEAVTRASGILFELLTEKADEIAFAARCHNEDSKND